MNEHTAPALALALAELREALMSRTRLHYLSPLVPDADRLVMNKLDAAAALRAAVRGAETPTQDDVKREIESSHLFLRMAKALGIGSAQSWDDLIDGAEFLQQANHPTARPTAPWNKGRLMLNSYGILCYEAGRKTGERELLERQAAVPPAPAPPFNFAEFGDVLPAPDHLPAEAAPLPPQGEPLWAKLAAYYRGVCANYEPNEPGDDDSACKHCWCFDDAHNAKALLDLHAAEALASPPTREALTDEQLLDVFLCAVTMWEKEPSGIRSEADKAAVKELRERLALPPPATPGVE